MRVRAWLSLAMALAWAASAMSGAAAEATRWTGGDLNALEACPDGGIKLPGSPTCVRIGGSVRADGTIRTTARTTSFRKSLTSSQHVEGRVSIDVRRQTELGPIRAYASVRSATDGRGSGRFDH